MYYVSVITNMKDYKRMVIWHLSLLILGYIVILSLKDFKYANGFLAGYLIIFIDLFILVRMINRLVTQKAITGFVFSSMLRWLLTGALIYISLIVLGLYIWTFALGIVLPFIVVLFAVIYEKFWRKEDGNGSSS